MDSSKNARKDDNGVKWVDVQGNLSCSDGNVIDLKWKARTLTNWSGEGIDQFGKQYEFRVITKKQYKQIDNAKKITKATYLTEINSLVKY